MAQAMKQDAPAQNEQGFVTDMSVGEILRRTREHYKQSVEHVEANLRIRAEQIIAIENNDLEKLPAKVYAIGFVRSYSEYLGLDGDKMVDLFKYQSANASIDPVLAFPVGASDSKTPPLWIVGLSLITAIAICLIWWQNHKAERADIETIPPVPAELKAELNIPANPAPPQSQLSNEAFGPKAQASQTPQAPTSANIQKGIILKMTADSWVEIRDANDKVLIARDLKAGDQYFVPDNPSLTMSLGNAGGVSLSVDGIPLAPIGQPAEVVRNLSLDGAQLKARFALDNPAQ